MRPPAGVFTCDWGSLGGLRPSQRKGPGLISGEARPLDRLRPCRSAPAGVFRPPPAPAGATLLPPPKLTLRRHRAMLTGRAVPPVMSLHQPQTPQHHQPSITSPAARSAGDPPSG